MTARITNSGISRDEFRQVLESVARTVHGTTRQALQKGLEESRVFSTTSTTRTTSSTSTTSATSTTSTTSTAAAVSSSDAVAPLVLPSDAELKDDVDRFVDLAFEQFDANQDGLLQIDEYRKACASHPFILAVFKVQP